MNYIEKTIEDSSKAFLNIVWPSISEFVGGGDAIPVEGVTTDLMRKKLDMLAGIDFWQIMDNDMGVRGIASRCQPISKDYHTFTIRCKLVTGNETEYQKRLRAINGDIEGLIYPSITVQSYLTSFDGDLISVGVIHTKALYDATEKYSWPEIKNGYEGNSFLAVDWYKLKDYGYRVKIVRAA
jgi:hypothetical protein